MRTDESSAPEGLDESVRSVKAQRDLTTLRLDSSGHYRSTFAPAPLTLSENTGEGGVEAPPQAEAKTSPPVRQSVLPRRALIMVLTLVGVLWAVPAYIIISARGTPLNVAAGGVGNLGSVTTLTPDVPLINLRLRTATKSPTPSPRPSATARRTSTATSTFTQTSTPIPPTVTPEPPTPTPQPTDTPTQPVPTAQPQTRAPVTQIYYRVRPGDNLITIAARYGTTVDAIMRANGLGSTVIYAGQTLVIPVRR